MNEVDRIKEVIKYSGMSVSAFSNKIGFNQSNLSKVLNNKREVNSNLHQAILNCFPEINRIWLLTGDGEMTDPTNDKAPVKSYTRGVPYYNVDFIGGFDLVLNDQTVVPEYLIDFKTYNEATCWCNVTGHSMEPEINQGDIIALKEIKDFSFLPAGEVYAIVTTNGMRTIKRIGTSPKDDCYTLIPTNKSPEYGIQEIKKNMIDKVYQVLGAMKRL